MKLAIVYLLTIFFTFSNQNMYTKENDSLNYTLERSLTRNKVGYYLSYGLEDISNKYYYYNKPIEQITMLELFDDSYLNNFLKYFKSEDEEKMFPITNLTAFLMARVEQLNDENAFLILSKMSKDPSFSYMGVELLSNDLMMLFFEQYLFLIKNSIKYDDYTLFHYLLVDRNSAGNIRSSANTERILSEEPLYDTYFLNYGQILLKTSALDFINKSNNSYLEAIRSKENSYEIDMIYARDSETVYYYDIYTPLRKELKEKLTIAEYKKYEEKIKPMFDALEIKNYHVNDPDGYVNMRSAASVNSSIVMQIPNGTYVYYMGEETNNWVKVIYRKPLSRPYSGYIYKDRLISKN